MANSVIKGFSSFFVSLGKILLLAIICCALGFAIVWPLWFFAVKSPNLYSVVVLVALAILLIFFVIKGLLRTLKQKTPEEKKSYFFNIFRGILLTVIFLVGIFLFISLVLNQLRLLGVVVFLVFSIIFGVCAIVIKKK